MREKSKKEIRSPQVQLLRKRIINLCRFCNFMRESGIGEICKKFLYSESRSEQRTPAISYLSERLGHPDSGSDFDKTLGYAKYLFRVPVMNETLTKAGIWCLQRMGYDALLLEYFDEIIGHTAFQVHKDNSLHIFSVEVLPQYQNRDLACVMVEEVVKRAREKKIAKVRIGGGGNKAINHILKEKLGKRANDLGIIVREHNWVDIVY